jgi:hypothetical protein
MGGPSVTHAVKISFSDIKDRISNRFVKSAKDSIQPFFNGLNPVQQWLVLITITIILPYFLNGHFFRLLRLLSIAIKGVDISNFELFRLATETFLLLYSSTLIINYRSKLEQKNSESAETFKGVHSCITFSKIPSYLKGPRPGDQAVTPIKSGVSRFKDDLKINPAFEKVFEELATKKYTPRDMPYFTDNPFDNVKGSQSRIYESLNPETNQELIKVEVMNGLDFLKQDIKLDEPK